MEIRSPLLTRAPTGQAGLTFPIATIPGFNPAGGAVGAGAGASPTREVVALVACCGAKVEVGPCRAEDLYVSPLFLKSRAYVEQLIARRACATWAILSARHGVLMPNAPVRPYDATLAAMTAEARRRWAKRTHGRLVELFPDSTFLVFAGARYLDALACHATCACAKPPRGHGPLEYAVPLARKGIGQQLAALDAALASKEAPPCN